VIVTDASAKSQEIARRMLRIAEELGVERTVVVANKIRPDETETLDAAFGHLERLVIPYDPTLESRTPDGSKPTEARELAELLTATAG
jgi:CO dehydrogenase nickel-insertion accessory protein CooC1